ncbi:MAG TPA: nucleotidyltransferase domain-containing protein [Candidatus Kapabacteria bacterium]
MRLEQIERNIILSTIARLMPKASVYLFGSRTDDTRRGGDIDLLLIGKGITRENVRHLKIELKDKLGDQKIDIIAEDPDDRTNFGKLVELEAVPL